MFLGGWRAPWPLSLIDHGVLNTGWWPVLWFLAKVVLLIFCFYWLRATLPRLRYDQFMALGWKVLIPASLVWIMIVAAFRELTNEGRTRFETLAYVGIPLAAVVLLASFFTENRAAKSDDETEVDVAGADAGYPIPVLTPAGPIVHDTQLEPPRVEVNDD